MNNNNIAHIGTALKWRNTFDLETTYYQENIVTACGCVFRCRVLQAKGITPIGLADKQGHLTFANPDVWDVVVDMSYYYNFAVDTQNMTKETLEYVKNLDEALKKQAQEIKRITPPSLTLSQLDNLGTDGSRSALLTLLKESPHTRYKIQVSSEDTSPVGVMEVFMDIKNHTISEVLTTHFIPSENGEINAKCESENHQVSVFYRIFNLGSSQLTITSDTWTEWERLSHHLGHGSQEAFPGDEGKELQESLENAWQFINEINQDLFQEISDRKDGDEGCRKYTDDSCQSLDRKIDTVQVVLEKDIADGDEAVRTELTSKINSLRGSSSVSSRDISRLEVWPFAKVVAEGDDIVKNPEAVLLKYRISVGDIVYSEQYRGLLHIQGMVLLLIGATRFRRLLM